MINFKKDEKWLITVDLDGTFLMSPDKTKTAHGSNMEVNPINIEVINKLIDKGHKVAIITGRPWKDTKELYNKLGLDSIIGNYNGTHIHYPGKEDFFTPLTFSMNREILDDILNEEILRETAGTIIIETLTVTHSTNIENDLAKMITKGGDRELVKWDITEPLKGVPMSSLIEIDLDKIEDPYDIVNVLKRKYGSAFFFRYWKTGSPDKPGMLLEISQKTANKGFALRQIAEFHNIPLSRTIAFGDGLNDREMLVEASIGVVMKNAKGTIKTYANDITDYTNNEGGVGRYLQEFFGLEN